MYTTGSRHGLPWEIPQVFQRRLQQQDMKQIKRFGRKKAQAGQQATAVSMIQMMPENGMVVRLLIIRQCFIRMEQQQQLLRYGSM